MEPTDDPHGVDAEAVESRTPTRLKVEIDGDDYDEEERKQDHTAANAELATDDAVVAAAATQREPSPASPSEAVGQLSMRDLFGVFFQLDTDLVIADPALVDTRGVLRSHFGDCVDESDIVFAGEELLRREMAANQAARHRAEAEHLFGVAGADALAQERAERYALVHATLPPPNSLTAPTTAPALEQEVWLVEMPKVAPNRQILHADPQPYFPSSCAPLVSDARMLFTPCNVMRWAYHGQKQLYMSNTRLVRWSDGSVTLHVGSDVHTMQPVRSHATLDLLGTDVVLSQRGGVTLPALATTLRPGEHYVIEPSSAASIEHAISAEGQLHRTVATRPKLPYMPLAMPPIDWAKPGRGRNLYEEFVAREYERREKELAKRYREGRPMSFGEQLARDQEMMRHLNQVDETTLRASHETRTNSIRNTAVPHPNRRSRLHRDLTLRDGDDPVGDDLGDLDDDNDNEDEEEVMDETLRKRAREQDVEERQRKMARYEQEQRDRFQPLTDALLALLPTLSMSTDAYASVDGTVAFLRSGSFAAGIIEKEIPVMLREVVQEVPEADVAAVAAAYETIFARRV